MPSSLPLRLSRTRVAFRREIREVDRLRRCPICDRDVVEAGSRYSKFSDRTFHYGVCAYCELGLVVDPREDYENLYDENYYAGRGADPAVNYLEEMADPNTIRNLEWQGLAKTIGPARPGGRVLDFGCGLGGLPRVLRSLGWDAIGYEDGFAIDWMRAADMPALEKLPDDESFDVIFAIEVVEHLVDPLSALREIRKQLAPGGRLIITTGNLARARRPLSEWSYAAVPEVHVTFWSPAAWKRALSLTGFEPIRPRRPLSPEVTQYKILKALPEAAHSLARIAPTWRRLGSIVDRRYGVAEFAEGTSPA